MFSDSNNRLVFQVTCLRALRQKGELQSFSVTYIPQATAVVHGTECHGKVVIWASGLSLSLPSKGEFAILDVFGPRYKIWHPVTLKSMLSFDPKQVKD